MSNKSRINVSLNLNKFSRNAFNEENRKLIVWMARHKWHTCARFLFDMYRYHAILILGEGGEQKKMRK